MRKKIKQIKLAQLGKNELDARLMKTLTGGSGDCTCWGCCCPGDECVMYRMDDGTEIESLLESYK